MPSEWRASTAGSPQPVAATPRLATPTARKSAKTTPREGGSRRPTTATPRQKGKAKASVPRPPPSPIAAKTPGSYWGDSLGVLALDL